jgi:two-component system, LuxR family, sensor kinase FixL
VIREPLIENIDNFLNDESFKDFFDKAHDLIHFILADGTILYVNQSWSKTLEYPMDEIQGSNVYDYVVEQDKHGFASYRKHIINGGITNLETVVRFRTKSGSVVSLEGFISVRKDGNEPLYTRGIFRDITAKLENEARLKERELYMHRLLRHAPNAVVVINEEGIVTFWNPKAEAIFGWTMEEVLGTSLSSSIVPVNHRTAHNEGMKRLVSTGEAHLLNKTIEITALHKAGNEFAISLTISQTEQDGKKVFIAFIRDITEQKANEAELENKRKQLEVSNQQLEQFAYVASHDLQEPLRKIRTFGDILSRHIDTEAAIRKYVDKIIASAERMSGLINSLLGYSRLSKEGIRYEKVDLNAILLSILSDYELLITQKNAEITFDTLPIIMAVPLQMNQLFYNLIGNALKFTKRNIKPIITITTTDVSTDEKNDWQLEPLKDYVEIFVRDNGIGFEQNYANKIFTIFQRLNDRSEYGGYGIGLALCKKVLDAHKGRIFAEGKLKEGATFKIILPVK